jgi:DNA helicase-2/ATP-dependent DNA helicase PcrA
MKQNVSDILYVMNLRPAQEVILNYERGLTAVSAVPGSGKTFILAMLAAELIKTGRVAAMQGQNVLVVTYLNSSVETFRARIRERLDELDLPLLGFDVRTLHSLALEIVRTAEGGGGEDVDLPSVADESLLGRYLTRAMDMWMASHKDEWRAFLPDDSPQTRARWRDTIERSASAFIRSAKNGRHRPDYIFLQATLARNQHNEGLAMAEAPNDNWADFRLVYMLAGVYDRFQSILLRQNAMDFDDLIWRAADLLEARPSLGQALRERWPYILEDEAQDSVPLQEQLLELLAGAAGNWVRVGDPNQAITSTFTAAHPRYFNAFADRPDVTSLPLPNSGRCAPLIFNAANALVDWVCDLHPVPEVRRFAFRRQHILPTPKGDAQPNPPDSEAAIRIKVYHHREDEELPNIAGLARSYAGKYPQHTLAILVPTNDLGHKVADHLDALGADYDSLLRGGRRLKEVAAVIQALLALMADPLDAKAYFGAHAALSELGHPAADVGELEPDKIGTLLRSIHKTEALLYPSMSQSVRSSLPEGVASDAEVDHIERLAAFLRGAFELRPLPADDMILALSDELFAQGATAGESEADLAIAYLIAAEIRQWRNLHPEWRLPDISANLVDVAEGRRQLRLSLAAGVGYRPEPGRITLATQHGAKGMEWDAVFLVGIDGLWIPDDLESAFLGVDNYLGADPSAEAMAQLWFVTEGDAGLHEGRTATDSAHIEVICERLRLFYVAITRARRYLHISRSRVKRQFGKERDAAPAKVLGVLHAYLAGHNQ